MSQLDASLLQALAPWRSTPAWQVAFSGGLDSSVLLYLLVRLRRQHSLPPISAVHVHHGLQEVADAWPAHCQAFCDALSIPLRIECIQVDRAVASLERAAREARYAALAEGLGVGEVLLTGQHRDDQAETLLFRLLRGAGVRGLGAMPVARQLGRGCLVRPLLQVARAELESYARQHGLCWIDDPSNGDSGFARNFLRNEVLPGLVRYWPQASRNLARSAEHLQEAQVLLDELAEADLASARAPHAFAWLGVPSLELQPLCELSEARQRNALRHWLSAFTLLPDTAHWAGWIALRDSGADAAPVWRLAGGELHRSQGRLWWLSGDWLHMPPALNSELIADKVVLLPGNGQVRLDGAASEELHLAYRRGGEMMQVAGRGRRDLKRLLNEAQVPSFARARLPLLFAGDELVAVANLPGLNVTQQGVGRLIWQPPSGASGLS